MFLECRGGYDGDGQQRAVGSFLIVSDDPHGENTRLLRCLVRRVTLKQLGHWMMATIKIRLPTKKFVELTLSGSYGGDGLPCTLRKDFWEKINYGKREPAEDEVPSMELWPYMHDLPQELADAFWKDDTGHNSAGVSGGPIRTWARKHIAELQKLNRTRREKPSDANVSRD